MQAVANRVCLYKKQALGMEMDILGVDFILSLVSPGVYRNTLDRTSLL